MVRNLASRTGDAITGGFLSSYLILYILDLLHDGRHGCGSVGRGFEAGKVRLLLARAALFVRMRKGGEARWRKERRIEKSVRV
jgi:hypothetical protein